MKLEQRESASWTEPLVNTPTGNAVKLIVCGKVGLLWFEGSDLIRVIN
jgi:hypothetical protein